MSTRATGAAIVVTVTLAVPLRPSLVACTLTEPGARAVTSPPGDTRATVVSLELQPIWRPSRTLPLPSLSSTASCAVRPTAIAVGEGVTEMDATSAGGGACGTAAGGEGVLLRPNIVQAATPRTTSTAAAPTSCIVLVRFGAAYGGGAGSAREARAGAGTPPDGRRPAVRGAGGCGGAAGARVRLAKTAVGTSATSGGCSGVIGSTGVTGSEGGASGGGAGVAAVAGIGVVGAAGIGVVGVDGSGVVGADVMTGDGGGVAGLAKGGTGLTGVAHCAASASEPPRASAFICWRTGSLCGGVPMASTASSSDAQRSAGFLASICSIACAM